MVICLATSGFSRASNALDGYLATPEHKIEGVQAELKDVKKQRECALRIAAAAWHIQGISSEQAEKFKRISGVSDKDMEAAFIDIIREWSQKEGWSSWDARLFSPDSARFGYAYLRGAIMWLGFCADTEGKNLLMDIATDSAKDSEFRKTAMGCYLTRANEKEVLSAIPRFLADDAGVPLRPSSDVYFCALWHYYKAEDNPQKREAILAALSAALTNEKEKEAFAEADRKLAEYVKEYAESPQRKAALERMNKPPDNPTQ
jgi:hypothetical protein